MSPKTGEEANMTVAPLSIGMYKKILYQELVLYMIRPKLDYAAVVSSQHFRKKNKNKLEKVGTKKQVGIMMMQSLKYHLQH